MRGPRLSSGGFTLIELLVVIALIALIGLVALPAIGNIFKVSLNSATRELASTVKEAYNATVMTGKVHRLVYDLKEQAFWAEIGPNTILLDTSETAERDARRKRFERDGDKKESSGFALAKTVTRRKMSLPRGVSFEDIVTERSNEPLREGTAYTHFFPHGITEQTILHLKDSSNHQITLVITPIIGRTRLIERYVSAEELARETQ